MSEVRDLLVATSHRVFEGERDVESELERSGLLEIGAEGDLGDVAAVIRTAAYRAPGLADGFAERVMPPLDSPRQRGALMRAIEITGALERVRDLTVQYAAERQQFGQPLNRFQSIQQMLAELAGEAALAGVAVDDAVAGPTSTRVGVAKVIAGRSAGRGAEISHQVHGAIGFTQEHRLHRYTTRLWQWRDEFGTEAEWAAAVGETVALAGSTHLWQIVTAG